MTKYNIRVYWTDKISPTIFEGVDRYLMEKGIWLIVKRDEEGRTAFLNVSTAREIVIEEVDDGDEYYGLCSIEKENSQTGGG